VAGVALVGAEAVERRFQRKSAPVELTPAATPALGRWKYGLTAAFTVIVLVATLAGPAPAAPAPARITSIDPLQLADLVIAADPNLLILDVRADNPTGAPGIPAAVVASTAEIPPSLALADEAATVVVFDDTGTLSEVPAAWPRVPDYRFLRGGFEAWREEALTPLEAMGVSLEERNFCARQNQIAAFFSGAAVKPSSSAPPVLPTGGPKKPKKKGSGC